MKVFPRTWRLSYVFIYLVIMDLSNLEFLREIDSSSLVDFDYDRNLFEYEQNSVLPVLKGRLKAKLDYWYTIGANNFVTDTIKFGYRIPFISTPCRAFLNNNKSASDNASFVESAISELVGNHSVVEVSNLTKLLQWRHNLG